MADYSSFQLSASSLCGILVTVVLCELSIVLKWMNNTLDPYLNSIIGCTTLLERHEFPTYCKLFVDAAHALAAIRTIHKEAMHDRAAAVMQALLRIHEAYEQVEDGSFKDQLFPIIEQIIELEEEVRKIVAE